MSDLEKLTEWFQAQIGVRETGDNNVIYNTEYYGAPVQGAAYPWCCAFIWDGFHQTGLSSLFCGGAKTAYCPYVMSWAQSHGRWFTGTYRAGDLLLYDWNGDGVADHIGFCTGWDGRNASSIEGNSNDAVELRARPAREILGAYRPEYPQSEVSDELPAADGEDEIYTVQRGDNLWDIAVRFYGDPLRYVDIQKANDLTGATIHPGDRLIIPKNGGTRTLTVRLSAKTADRLEALAAEYGLSASQIIEKAVALL